MNRLDKIWMVFNKKPHSRKESYFYVAGSWLISGLIWMAAVFGIILTMEADIKKLLVCACIFLHAILYSITITYIDYKQGYADAIHAHCLQRRQDRLDKIAAPRQGGEGKE